MNINAVNEGNLVEQIQVMNRVHAALSSSLKREEVYTLILATLTAPRGLNFQRAFLFLYDAPHDQLKGHMAMGPSTAEEAEQLRAEMEAEESALAQITATLGDEGTDSDSNVENMDSLKASMRGLQQSAYWIAMLQQYDADNALTQKLRKVEQVGQPQKSSPTKSKNGKSKDSPPRFIDLLNRTIPMVTSKKQMKLSETMQGLLADRFIVLTLRTREDPVGLVVLDSRFAEEESLGTSHLQFLEWFSTQTQLSLENSQLFSDLQSTYEALREVDKMKSAFLSTISHELRTPLTAINGFVDLLIKGKVGQLQDGQVDLLRRVHNHGQNLTNIVNDLIEVAEVQSGGLDEIDLEVVDPLICLMNVLPKLDGRRANKSINIEPQIEGKTPYIKSNARLLERIYYHILDNAVKFIDKQDGSIKIKFRKGDDNRLHISVADNGVGIEPERLRTIFEGFFQVDNRLARDFNGMGIGLKVVKLLLDASRGTIHVESVPGEGSTFIISYPIADVTVDGMPHHI
jgi:signal transduction histidine kinase